MTNHHISAVFTARESAETVRALLEAHIGQEVELEVTDANQGSWRFRVTLVQPTFASGVTLQGQEVAISLGEPAESLTKHPTIVIG